MMMQFPPGVVPLGQSPVGMYDQRGQQQPQFGGPPSYQQQGQYGQQQQRSGTVSLPHQPMQQVGIPAQSTWEKPSLV